MLSRRIAGSIVRHRARWTSLAILTLVFAAALASRLELRHDAADFLPRGWKPPSTAFRTAERVVVVLESDRPLPSAAAAPVLDSLAARLARIPDVRAVEHRVPPALGRLLDSLGPRHLFALLDTTTLARLAARARPEMIAQALLGIPDSGRAATGSVSLRKLRAQDPLGLGTPLAALARAASGDAPVRVAGGGYLAAPNGRAWVVAVEPEPGHTELASARMLVANLDSALAVTRRDPAFAGLGPGVRLFAVGRPVAYVQAFDIARRDIGRAVAASAIAVFTLLALFFGNARAPFVVLGTVAFGVAVTGAVAWIVAGSLGLIAWLFIAVLVGLGDEFAVYIVSHYWMGSDPGETREAALTRAIARPGPAILMGGATAVIAFLSLLFVTYPVVVQVGWVTALGLVILIASSFTVLPLALSWTPPARMSAPAWRGWVGAVERAAQIRPAPAILGWTVLIAGAVWLARDVRLEPHPWRVAVRANPATAELDRVQRLLGTSFTPFVLISRGGTAEEALSQERTAVLELYRIRHHAGIARIESLSRWLPTRSEQEASAAFVSRQGDGLAGARIARDFAIALGRAPAADPRLAREYLPRVTPFYAVPKPLGLDELRSYGLADITARHVRPDGEGYVALSFIYLRESPWAEGAVERFTRALSTVPALAKIDLSGDALRGASSSRLLRRDVVRATGIGFSLVLVLLAVRFRRRPSRILLALVPLAAGISVVLGAMGLLGIELTILTLTITPILVGIGVDDGIHMVERLDLGEAPESALRDVALPMTITTATTISGFACLALASFSEARLLGLIAALGLGTCLLASLHLVPLLWRATNRVT